MAFSARFRITKPRLAWVLTGSRPYKPWTAKLRCLFRDKTPWKMFSRERMRRQDCLVQMGQNPKRLRLRIQRSPWREMKMLWPPNGARLLGMTWTTTSSSKIRPRIRTMHKERNPPDFRLAVTMRGSWTTPMRLRHPRNPLLHRLWLRRRASQGLRRADMPPRPQSHHSSSSPLIHTFRGFRPISLSLLSQLKLRTDTEQHPSHNTLRLHMVRQSLNSNHLTCPRPRVLPISRRAAITHRTICRWKSSSQENDRAWGRNLRWYPTRPRHLLRGALA
jgi:hypothetical protein